MDRVAELVRREAAGENIEYVRFWGHRPRKDGRIGTACLSQWWPAAFVVGGERFATAEHFMMVGKARLFGDEEAAMKILETDEPAAAKKLGRTVRGFDDETWQAAAFDIVVRGNLAKFDQHDDLGKFLVGTGDAVLVEASPVDPVWGIGLAADDPRATTPSTWRGTNLLGFALMEVRDRLVS
ncbi:NADAR family protein [Labedaea rhizosphaerae]|uniref:NADAR domain-containing protein n=1 Tax=Labedaea rhizosphaerae TaxID=598644 RepID=A0A4R6SKW5_LABRH|nr:NADAR family protein [Labedaea rhizosphaerae]TDQ04577.1 hypothetical protein EV186_101529 [Labedaea rhizosphaerae]